MQSSMFLVWIGALLVVAGIVLGAVQALRRGRLSDPHPIGLAGATLEPRERPRSFQLRLHWPAVVLVALGIVLMLIKAVV